MSASIDHRHTCTKDDPWAREKSFYGDHPDAKFIEVDEEGAWNYECPHCGRCFREWE